MNAEKNDPLNHLLKNFSLKAGVFFAGNLCGIHDFPSGHGHGHLHLINSGVIRISTEQEADVRLDVKTPTLLLLSQPQRHRITTDENDGAEVICGTVQFGEVGVNPVTLSLPPLVVAELSSVNAAENCMQMLLTEAFSDLTGQQAIMNRLCEVLTIYVLRHCIATGLTKGGALAGLADRRLSKALQVIHETPASPLNLDSMASLAGMSRARFAAHFKEVIGETPADYLTAWRLSLCQKLLMNNLPIKQIAGDVGYQSASALTRAFVRKFGCSPTEWQRSQG
jgi:AraC-like DNA-binding protein